MSDYKYLLSKCSLCPRNCLVNRNNGELGFCGAGAKVKIALVSLHQWEEPCISGENGSGTIFFSNCNLKCAFCQNYEISHDGKGMEVSIDRLAEIFLEQEERGAHNINLVTAVHYVPQIIEAIDIAKSNGLNIPILYNSSGYECVETLKLLDGYVDVYLPDIKYYDDKIAVRYSNAPKYFEIASKAVLEMFDQVGSPKFGHGEIITKGVIIRHMMLPGQLFDSKKIIDYLYNTFGQSVFLSLMNQYTPTFRANQFKEINRQLSPKAYDSLIDYCLSLGMENVYIQLEGSNGEKFIPEFDYSGVFKRKNTIDKIII